MLNLIKIPYTKITKSLIVLFTFAFVLVGMPSLSFMAQPVSAATTPPTCVNGTQLSGDQTSCQVSGQCTSADITADPGNCAILAWLLILINALSGLVGIIVVIMIIVGGIQYSAAGDDPQKITEAKQKITNALLALFVFIFMFAFLQWVVPGGLF